MAIRNIIQKAEQEYPPSLKQEVDPIASGLLTGKADLVHTHTATQISDSTAAGRTLLTSNLANQRTHLAFFPSFSGRSSFPVNGDVNRVYTALDTSKIYAWISLLNDYVEISPTPTGELDNRYTQNLGNVSGIRAMTTGEYNSLTPISGVLYILI